MAPNPPWILFPLYPHTGGKATERIKVMDKLTLAATNSMRSIMDAQSANVHNMANANTPGFRRDIRDAMQSVYATQNGLREITATPTEALAGVSAEQGKMLHTASSTDVAMMSEDGYFGVQDPSGQVAMTRRGDFKVNDQNQLQNGEGVLAVNAGGAPITIPPYRDLNINERGEIFIIPAGSDDNVPVSVGQLMMVNVPTKNLQKGKDNLLRPELLDDLKHDPNLRMKSGYLEQSNVNTISSMVRMLELARGYERSAKLLKSAKELDQSGSSLMRMQ